MCRRELSDKCRGRMPEVNAGGMPGREGSPRVRAEGRQSQVVAWRIDLIFFTESTCPTSTTLV